MMEEEQHLESRTPDVRSVATEIPFDQAVDLSKGDSESLGPGRIHSAAVARPPPSPSMSRRSPRTSSTPVHANPVLVIPNSSYSPNNSVHSATSGSRSTIRPRLLVEGPVPFDEIVARPRSSSQSSSSPSHGGGTAASVPMGDTLLRKSRDFTPTLARNSPLAAALAGEDLDDNQRQQNLVEEQPSFQKNYKMAPPRVSVPVSRLYVDEDPSALTGELSFEKPRHLPVRVSPEVEDEDSLFDFEERNRKKKQQQLQLQQQQQQQRGQRSRARETFADEETDDSDMLPPVSLQERAQEAWKRKQRMSQQNHQTEAAFVEPPPMKLDTQPVVSFGKDDVVHNYDPQDDTLDDTLDDATLAGRSLNSLYTKSAESEVEDIIKDIFMIGSGEGTNPGRRKVKYNPRIQARNKEPEPASQPEPEDESFEDDDNTFDTKEEDEEEDEEEEEEDEGEEDDTYEGTFEDTTATFTEATGTLGETTDTSFPTNSNSLLFEDAYTTNTDTHDDTTATGTNTALVESTVTYTDGETTASPPSFWPPPQKAASPPSEQPKPKKSVTFNDDEKKDDDPLAEAWNFMEGRFSAMGAALGLDKESKKVQESSPRNATGLPQPRSTRDAAEYTDEETATLGSATTGTLTTGGGWNFFDFASEVLLGPVKCEPARQELIKSAPSLDEDSRLVDLAMQAAITMHRLNGYEFDSSRDVDINHEIKFSVVDLVLPLGIIFQENEKGCFVTKILPDGSAARTNGDIQIGDQLAAVDGTSAIDMTVDEIASMVRVKKQVIELTFLRYVGPLRPEIGTVIQEEGYEIRAAENRGKLMARQTSVATTMPVAAVSPIPPLRNNVKPKGILKNSITPPPVEPPKPKEEEKNAIEPIAAQAPIPVKEKKRFRLFGRRKKQK